MTTDLMHNLQDSMTAQKIARALDLSWNTMGLANRQQLIRTVATVRDYDHREEYKVLSSALYDRYSATPNPGSLEWLGQISNPTSVSAMLQIRNPDGTVTNQVLQARFDLRPGVNQNAVPLNERSIEITVKAQWQSCDEDYWERIIVEHTDPYKRVVMQHEHWVIGNRVSWRDRGMAGYGGREWTVFFYDGITVHTNNLWHQGVIPPMFRDRLPDNCVLVSGHHEALTPELMEHGW